MVFFFSFAGGCCEGKCDTPTKNPNERRLWKENRIHTNTQNDTENDFKALFNGCSQIGRLKSFSFPLPPPPPSLCPALPLRLCIPSKSFAIKRMFWFWNYGCAIFSLRLDYVRLLDGVRRFSPLPKNFHFIFLILKGNSAKFVSQAILRTTLCSRIKLLPNEFTDPNCLPLCFNGERSKSFFSFFFFCFVLRLVFVLCFLGCCSPFFIFSFFCVERTLFGFSSAELLAFSWLFRWKSTKRKSFRPPLLLFSLT